MVRELGKKLSKKLGRPPSGVPPTPVGRHTILHQHPTRPGRGLKAPAGARPVGGRRGRGGNIMVSEKLIAKIIEEKLKLLSKQEFDVTRDRFSQVQDIILQIVSPVVTAGGLQ